MIHPIPAPGFTKASGTRPPSPAWGDEVFCQIRTGWVDMFGPWPVKTTNWKHDGSAGDVVAIRKAN